MSKSNSHDGNRRKVGFFNTLRWSIGEIIGQLLIIPAVVVSAYMGLNHQSWWIFFAVAIPLVGLVVFLTKKLSGENPYLKEKTSKEDSE